MGKEYTIGKEEKIEILGTKKKKFEIVEMSGLPNAGVYVESLSAYEIKIGREIIVVPVTLTNEEDKMVAYLKHNYPKLDHGKIIEALKKYEQSR